MMILSYKEVAKRFEEAYPELKLSRFIFCKDTRYAIPIYSELEEAIKRNSVADLQMPDGADCDDMALQLMARVRMRHPDWPFGECSGRLYAGHGILPHDRCVCICEEGVYDIEPSNNTIMEANPDNFSVYWIRV